MHASPRFHCSALVLLLASLCAGCAPGPAGRVRAGGAMHPEDPAGLFERVAAGNIDQAGSAAWRRWGEGYDAWLRDSDRRFEPPRERGKQM